MKTNHYNSAIHLWPKMAQSVNEVAARLQAHYGEEGIPSAILKREVEKMGGYGWDSVIPSDYCYNVINRAEYSFQHLLLLRVRRGRYKYVGPFHIHTGPIMWKPMQESERKVGSWREGNCVLEVDPRL